MMGHKTLAEIRAELEAALGHGSALPSGQGDVAESLRRFLGCESDADAGPELTEKPRPRARRPGPSTGRRRHA